MKKEIKKSVDTSLVSMYINGDEAAFAKLVKKYKTKVYTTIYMIVKDRAIAEDLTQDAFIKAIHKLKSGTYNESGKFGPWLVRIAYNLGIDYFRKQKRYPTVAVEDEENVFTSTGRIEDSMEAVHIKNDTLEQLRASIEKLPEAQREVLKMRHYAEMSFQEIAESTGVSINTALGRMRYALINMRKMLENNNFVYDATIKI